MNFLASNTVLTFSLLAGLAPEGLAQTELTCNGFADVHYVGAQVQDFLVPSLPGADVYFTVQGADGGQASHTCCIPTSTTTYLGGEGAQAVIGCTIGTGTGELMPGGTVRFLVGERGKNDSGTGGLETATASGGGGSAVLYLPPGGTWATEGVILAAAGGGGGASSSSVTGDGPGQNGRATECGGSFPSDSGGAGGCNGQGGQGTWAGAGGGAFTSGTLAHPNWGDTPGRAGFPSGGIGGFSSPSPSGGWGFGGGGGAGGVSGGGGGGYSGGGADSGSSTDDPDGPGYGGGSYINSAYSTASSGTLAGFSPWTDDGFAQYIITSYIANSQPHLPVTIFDGTPISGTFCGAEESSAADCGFDIDGADLWYLYTNPSNCELRDLTLTVTGGDAEFQSYNNLVGAPSSAGDCRSFSTNGVYADTLLPGQTIRLRIQSPTGMPFTFVANSVTSAGQVDCDNNGISDVCQISSNPSLDCDGNGLLDVCDLAGGAVDCDNDGILDICEPSASCPPPNDLRQNAAAIVEGDTLFDTSYATYEQWVDCQPGFEITADIWYSFTATRSGQLIVIADAESTTSAGTRVQLEDPVTGDVLACDFTTYGVFGGVDSRVVKPVVAGETVLIFISTTDFPDSALARGVLSVTIDTTVGDLCSQAQSITNPDQLPASMPFDLYDVQPTSDVGNSCTYASPAFDTWFSYTSVQGGLFRFTADTDKVRLALWDSCGGTELACATNELPSTFGGFTIPELDYEMAPGETVLIQISESSQLEGYEVVGNLIVEDPCTDPELPVCSLFTSNCNGDGGDLMGCTFCPCGNGSTTGTVGGCRNSTGTAARLLAGGSSSVLAGDLRFQIENAPPQSACLLTSGNVLAPANPSNPCFGLNTGIAAAQYDGLRCVVQGVLRHGIRPSDANGSVGVTTPGWGAPDNFFNTAAFAAGATRHFQAIYRDDSALVCMRGLNTTQAITVDFTN